MLTVGDHRPRFTLKGICAQAKKRLCINVSFRKEIWIMDPATDAYYRWLTVIAIPVFYNLIMLVTR